MRQNAGLYLLQRLKGSTSADAHDLNNIETSALNFFFFLQGMPPKEIQAIPTEPLGEHAPSYAIVKNWMTHFKRGSFSTCDAPRPGRPKTVTTPEIIDQINELIL
jgi:transposase